MARARLHTEPGGLEPRFEPIARVPAVVRLVIDAGERSQQVRQAALARLLVLHGIAHDEQPARRQHAMRFGQHVSPRVEGELVQQEDDRDRVERSVRKREMLDVLDQEARRGHVAQPPARVLHVPRRQVDTVEAGFRHRGGNLLEERTRAAREVRDAQRRPAPPRLAHEWRKRHAPHHRGGAEEQRLHAEVVELRGVCAEPAVRLPVEGAPVVARIAVTRRGVRDIVEAGAPAAHHDAWQIREERGQRGELGAREPGAQKLPGVETAVDVALVLREELAIGTVDRGERAPVEAEAERTMEDGPDQPQRQPQRFLARTVEGAVERRERRRDRVRVEHVSADGQFAPARNPPHSARVDPPCA